VFRRINFAHATPDELKQLTQTCEVFDEADCKAGKMDPECFSSSLDPHRTELIKIIRGYLLEGEESTKNMEIETCKLNIYSAHLIFNLHSWLIRLYLILYCFPGKGSSSKPHVDPPRNKKMFGSLVIVFPTHHEGGALFLRHRGREWIFDHGQALAGGALDRPSIGYVAFLNDIEQEVAPVTSGHCVTLTYNLYFDDGGRRVSGKGAAPELLIPPKPPNQDGFREAFNALLENPEFMAEGGALVFGLRHGYSIKYDLKPVYDVLKGSDSVVYQCVRALGFEPTLNMYYNNEGYSEHEGMIVDKVLCFLDMSFEQDDEQGSVREFIKEKGGIFVREEGGWLDDDPYCELEVPEPMAWVTPKTTYSRKEARLPPSDEDEDEMDYTYEMPMRPVYGDACMIVRIGKAGDRLGYPTVAQVKRTYKRVRDFYSALMRSRYYS
jgi:hypothetical protein